MTLLERTSNDFYLGGGGKSCCYKIVSLGLNFLRSELIHNRRMS